jgi:hypothetical protein
MKAPNTTPGPWRIKGEEGMPTDCYIASHVRGGEAIAEARTTHRLRWDEARANAQAIAALPELLEALEKCHAFFREMQTGGYAIDCDHEADTARAALLKAGYTP